MRLIDADAFTEEVDSWGCNDYDKYDFLEAIDNAPTVPLHDFKEGYKQAIIDGKTNYSRPQGEWIDHSEDDGYVECPICGHLTNCEGNIEELHYCWNCGAKMRKGDRE